MQRQVNALVEIVNEAGKDISSEDAKDLEGAYNAVMKMKLQG